MKPFLITILIICAATTVNAQFKAQQFVDNLPALPDDMCKVKLEDRTAFLSSIHNLQKQVDEQIKVMSRQTKVDDNQTKNAAINQMATQYGLSSEEIQKMKNGKKMSAADKTALADKMMQQQTNISMDEIKNMQKRSKDGKKAWGQAYGAEAFAMTQATQGSGSQTQAGSDNFQIIQQLQNLNAQVQQRRMNIQMEYQKIETDPERIKMENRIQAWNSKITSMTGADAGQGQKMDSIASLVSKEKKKYCEKYMPLYQSVLDAHYADLKVSYTDYIRIAELNRIAANIQSVKVNLPMGPEIEYFNYIKEYLSRLSGAFVYSLNQIQ